MKIEDQLKNRLERFRRGEIEIGENSRVIVQENDRLLLRENGGEDIEITFGELLTDGEWGVKYQLDPKSVPVKLAERFFIEDAYRQMRALNDEEIITEEINKPTYSEKDQLRIDTYLTKQKQLELGTEEPGLIAETMVKSFLKKLTIDYGLDFEIIDADVRQDIEHKIDFIIHRQVRKRGVGVSAHEEDIGIQFTISQRPERLEHKQKQLERVGQGHMSELTVEDVVLVSVPLKNIKELHHRWQESKSPGGPDKLWDDDTKEMIFSNVLAGIFSDQEISSMWEKIKRAES